MTGEPIRLDPWQEKIVRAYLDARRKGRRIFVLAARRPGRAILWRAILEALDREDRRLDP